jgi:hypothetical protein
MNMTIEQALELIDHACRKVLGSRDDHALLAQAIQVIKEKLADGSKQPE